jgi:formylglycine-generating enzyme required for sulfatase activity
MKTFQIVASIAALMWVTAMTAWAASPMVSNVSVAQREGDPGRFTITYDLEDADGDACLIFIMGSRDNGQTWDIPIRRLSGHYGGTVSPGPQRQAIWDAAADVPGIVAQQFRIRVMADDNTGPGPMVIVPGGDFELPEGGGRVPVDTFYIDQFEVTNQFYAEFLNAGGNDDHFDASQRINKIGSQPPFVYSPQEGYERHPVVSVCYNDAFAFCNWRSERAGLPAGSYRLPKRLEWQKAGGWDPTANGGRGKTWRYGFREDSIDGTKANYRDSGIGSTAPVGSYKPSYFGCYDISGNVWEWGELWDDQRALTLGGSFDYPAESLRTGASAESASTAARSSNFGFRCVLAYLEK